MRFAAVAALFFAATAHAGLWCYSSESVCESQLTDCEWNTELSEWCGEVD